ncbi:hypothetical protein F5Y19DRAFT_471762 [Xylariaceae sp. FL1651]|nr:hypothetical protein F5Y19DRAFT_471762 [Xylariaceae sp. FL1651]
MTASGPKTTTPVNPELATALRNRWKPLGEADEIFNDCPWQPIEYVFASDQERKLCFKGCENIDFQTRASEPIWTAPGGDGQIELPANCLRDPHAVDEVEL